MKKYIYEVNSEGFIVEVYLGEFDDKGHLISPEGNFITTDLPQPLLYYKPRWNGQIWIEGATKEEIEEFSKPQPVPPTQTEMLATELARTNKMVLELTELILGGM